MKYSKKEVVEEVSTEGKELDLGISQLTGIGAAGKAKLESVGIKSVFDLCIRGAQEIKNTTGMPESNLNDAMNEAWEIVNKVGICRPKDMDIFELEAYKKSLPKIRCGCDELDDKLLKGGLEMESLTEIYGEYGSGKTQYCYSVAIEAIGKHDFNVLWIDCEDTFDPSRLIDAARARGFGNTDDEIRQKFYPKIKYIHTPNTDRLVREIDNLSSNILDKKYKLIILDGAIGQFREEYRGRGELSVRQNNLKRFMSLVRNIAFFFCCAVVMTNQVQSDPGLPPMMDPIKPIGGHIVGHTSSYRLYFKKAGSKRIARMVDSPKTPIAETLFELNDKGVDNVSKK